MKNQKRKVVIKQKLPGFIFTELTFFALFTGWLIGSDSLTMPIIILIGAVILPLFIWSINIYMRYHYIRLELQAKDRELDRQMEILEEQVTSMEHKLFVDEVR